MLTDAHMGEGGVKICSNHAHVVYGRSLREGPQKSLILIAVNLVILKPKIELTSVFQS